MPTSPVPGGKKTVASKEIFLDFPSAIKEVTQGKKVSRKEWGSKEEHMYINKGGWLCLFTGGEEHTFHIRDVDLKGTDYFVIN